MTRPRKPGAREVIQRANQIKLRRRRYFPGGVAFHSRLFNARQVEQAVGLIRQRGTDKDRELLVAAGYAPSKPR